VSWGGDFHLVKLLNDITVMLINDNECNQLHSVELRETWLLNQLNVVLDLLFEVLSTFLESSWLSSGLKLDQGVADFSSPLHLGHGDQNLTLVHFDNVHEFVLLKFATLGTGHVGLIIFREFELHGFLHL